MRIETKTLWLTNLLLLIGLASTTQAHTIQYATTFGPEAVGATGSGSALVTIDLDLLTMRVEANFAGLSGNTTASHIHCCTAAPFSGTVGVATITPSFTGWPTGVTSGSYDHSYDVSLATSFNTTFVNNNGGTANGALSALIAGLDSGRAYFNIHTSTFTGGEIRGFLTPIPEPGTALLLGLGLAALARPGRR